MRGASTTCVRLFAGGRAKRKSIVTVRPRRRRELMTCQFRVVYRVQPREKMTLDGPSIILTLYGEMKWRLIVFLVTVELIILHSKPNSTSITSYSLPTVCQTCFDVNLKQAIKNYF